MARPVLQRGNSSVSTGGNRTKAAPGLTVQQPIINEAPRENNFDALASALGVVAEHTIQKSAEQVAEDDQWFLDNAQNAAAAAGIEGKEYESLPEEYKQKPERILRKIRDSYDTARAGRETLQWTTEAQVEFSTLRRENPDLDEDEIEEFWAAKREAFFAEDENGNSPFADNPKQRKAILEQMLRAEETAKLETLPEAIANVTKAAVQETNVMWSQVYGNQPLVDGVNPFDSLIEMYKANRLPEDVIREQVVAMGISMAGANSDPAWLDKLPAKFALADPATVQKLTVARAQIDRVVARKEREALAGQQVSVIEEFDRIADSGEYLTDEQKQRAIDIGISPSKVASWASKADARLEKIKEDAEEERKEAEAEAKVSTQLIENPALLESTKKIEDGYSDRMVEALRSGDNAAANFWLNKAYDNGYIPTVAKLRMNKVPTDWGGEEGNGYQRWFRTMSKVYQQSDVAYGTLNENSRIHFEAALELQRTSEFSDKEIFQKLRGRDVKLGKARAARNQTSLGTRLTADLVGSDAGLPVKSAVYNIVEKLGSFNELSDDEVTELATKVWENGYFTDGGRVYERSVIPDEDHLEFLQREASKALAKGNGKRRAVKIDYDDIVVAHAKGQDTIQFRDRGTGATLMTLPSKVASRMMRADKTLQQRAEARRKRKFNIMSLGPEARRLQMDALNIKK